MRIEISPRLAISSFETGTSASDPVRWPLLHEGAWSFLEVLGSADALACRVADLPQVRLRAVIGLAGDAQAFANGYRRIDGDATG